MDMYNLYESTEETVKQLQSLPRYHKVSDNGNELNIRIEPRPFNVKGRLLNLDLYVEVKLNEDLEMGTHLFCDIMSQVLQILKSKVPSLSSEDLGSQVTITLNEVEIEFGFGVMDIFEFIDRPLVNELRVPRELSQLLQDGTDEYCLATPDQLPRFEENYMKEVSRITKRAKTIYKAFEKGTLNGEHYELPPNPVIRIRQTKRRYDLENKIIRPDLNPMVSTTGKYKTTLEPEVLTDYLTMRFKTFGINFHYIQF